MRKPGRGTGKEGKGVRKSVGGTVGGTAVIRGRYGRWYGRGWYGRGWSEDGTVGGNGGRYGGTHVTMFACLRPFSSETSRMAVHGAPSSYLGIGWYAQGYRVERSPKI